MCIFNCADAEFAEWISECSICHYLKIGTSFLLMQLHSINTKCSYSLKLSYNRKENTLYKKLIYHNFTEIAKTETKYSFSSHRIFKKCFILGVLNKIMTIFTRIP